MVRASLIDSADPRWTQLLGSVTHDFYHLPAYAELSAREERGIARAPMYVTDGGQRMLLPLIAREIRAVAST